MAEIPERVFDTARDMYQQYLDLVWDIHYQSGGVLTSEMLLFLSASISIGANSSIVESGRRNGYSTKIIGEFLNEGIVDSFHSFEIDPNPEVDAFLRKKYPRLLMFKGDSKLHIPNAYKDKRDISLLLDGPKGPPAMDMVKQMKPKLAAIHDLHRYNQNGKENKHRINAERIFPHAYFSDQQEWIDEFGDLDEKKCLRGEYASRAEMTACGFTLMVVES